MKKVFATMTLISALFAAHAASAQERIELGVGVGQTQPFATEKFKDSATAGNSNNYWLGYGFDKNWGVEAGLDVLTFNRANSRYEAISLSGVYRFLAENAVHPIAKFGISSFNKKDPGSVSSVGGKLAGGIEADYKYVSVGALINYHYISKATQDQGPIDAIKDAQAIVPTLFLTIHNGLTQEKEVSVAQAPAAVAVVKTDVDHDGVFDEDDKCPNTPAGVVVNSIGCSQTEKASVKIQVEFASGQAVVESAYASEITALANFMKKFPETKIEVAGYTDSTGSAARNTALSQKRADSVKAALVAEGIDASRLTAKGYGPQSPIADNKTKEGRQMNRRVMAQISVVTEKKK